MARQVRRWDAQRRGELRKRLPCVAISRLPWAYGSRIGQRLAESLDYGFFAQEIVDRIARERGLEQSLVQGLDERVRSTVERYVADSFRERHFTESDYLRQVTRIVSSIGERGAAVLVGRGAPFILDAQRALRLLVVAPEAVRRERLARAAQISSEEAGRRLAEADTTRREFALRQFGVRQEDPLLYDLVLNSARLDVEGAVAVVREALTRCFPQAGRA